MKKFTKEQINATREYFLDEGFPEFTEEIDGIKIRYFKLPQSLEPSLPDFIFRMTGETPSEGYVLGVSDSIPANQNLYPAFHEYVEFIRNNTNVKGKCVNALEAELTQVPEEIKPEYIKRRKEFFKNLIDYVKDKEDYTSEDVQEFQGSLSKLGELAKDK